jgi:hypothetical protein
VLNLKSLAIFLLDISPNFLQNMFFGQVLPALPQGGGGHSGIRSFRQGAKIFSFKQAKSVNDFISTDSDRRANGDTLMLLS